MRRSLGRGDRSEYLLDLVFLEQPDPGREGRDHQSRSEKSEQTGEFCIETEHAPRGHDPEKEIAGSHRVNPRGKAVLISEKIHLSDPGGVLGVFRDEAQKNNGAKIQCDDSHRPEPQYPKIVRVVVLSVRMVIIWVCWQR